MDNKVIDYDGIDLTELLNDELTLKLIATLKKEFSREDEDDSDDEWIKEIEKKIKGE